MVRLDIDWILDNKWTILKVLYFSPDFNFPFNDDDKLKPTDLTEIFKKNDYPELQGQPFHDRTAWNIQSPEENIWNVVQE